ncbi:MAG TPA: PilZ domain-containing protein [Terriglobales bacterium]|nr:PilZ domain-containing protein [Terriglobales bacterium]
MVRLLTEVIPLFQCSHEFSWPRRLPTGDYYQVCLRCGAEYGYDWTTMRRTERVHRGTAVQTRAHSNRKSGWKPRARRLAVELPLRFRVEGASEWTEGVVRNISHSGVLFQGISGLEHNTRLELIFEMPEAISGQAESQVLCQGRVIRTIQSGNEEQPPSVAVALAGYEFLHQRKLPRTAETNVR